MSIPAHEDGSISDGEAVSSEHESNQKTSENDGVANRSPESAESEENCPSDSVAPQEQPKATSKYTGIDVEEKKRTKDILPAEFALMIDQHADSLNTNWGELETAMDLYTLADGCSQDLGGVPDFILREAVQLLLELKIRNLDNTWLRKHLVQLQRIWRIEVDNEKVCKRPTMVSMESKEVHPFLAAKRKRKHRGAVVNQSIMGVSSLLAQARSQMIIDGQQHEVVENANGGFEVNGEPLSFASWGRMTTDDSVVALEGYNEFDNKVAPNPNVLEYEPAPPKKCKPEPQKEERTKPPKAKNKRRRRVSEEGELSSQSSSSSSNSSSESDDDDFSIGKKSTVARRIRRNQARTQGVSDNHSALRNKMSRLYIQRFDAVSYLSLQQKVDLLKSFRMVFGARDESMVKMEKMAAYLSKPV